MNNGDFIKVEYETRIGDDKKLVETSKEDLAKREGIFDEKVKYGDVTLIVGDDGIFKEINDSFLKAEKGQEVEVTVPPVDAYGQRVPSNIKVHTIREFQRLKIDPQVGKEVTINNKTGRVISVTPGRVLVDYNHKWAGKTVYYKYKINDVITDPNEKLKAILYNYYPGAQFETSIDSSINITVPDSAKFETGWLDAKYNVVNTARKYIPGLDIMILEKYEKEAVPEVPATEEKQKETEQKEEAVKTEENDKPRSESA
ncbi:MAG: FKBP-type peptidyl-prolyl cis-trans isomerase [Thermoplasmata archaeon]